MTAYYNEIDPFAAKWLRNLIAAGHIAPGDVDERSIVDVRGSDLAGYDQCHFFAGIGGWSYALRLADWSDDKKVWTGSCPCQPLSVAGLRQGHSDERHLWPAFHRLIAERNPPTVFGEQVASKDGREWFSAVRTDLEAVGYACGGADLCAAGVGAPHIRQRLYWVANANMPDEYERTPGKEQSLCDERDARVLEHTTSEQARIPGRARESGIADRIMGDPEGQRLQRPGCEQGAEIGNERGRQPRLSMHAWSDCDWLPCRDGKFRPVESGTFPLAHGVSNRMGRLRGYGNAIVPQVAAEFIRSYIETMP